MVFFLLCRKNAPAIISASVALSLSNTMKKKYFVWIFSSCSLCALLALYLILYCRHRQEEWTKVHKYIEQVASLEREYQDRLPIYSDYIRPAKARLLRRYLLPDHLRAIRNTKPKLKPIQDDLQIQKALEDKSLVPLLQDQANYFFYNLPPKYRYLSAGAYRVLQRLGEVFQRLLEERGVYKHVKFALSSALRPQNYQKSLGQKNPNAASLSSHSYGASFDVFFDEFYVSLPEAIIKKERSSVFGAAASKEREEALRALGRKLGFLLGRSLRRQFRSILSEAALELQKEGLLYVILEKQQRCLHISAVP